MPTPTHPIDRWHQLVAARNLQGLQDLLDDNAVFLSPILHRPQQGKALTAMYLSGAAQVLFNPSFRYVRELRGASDAVLEFEVTVDEVQINGVDLVHWNEAGRITEFKVMLRPLKAIQLVQQKMAALLAAQSQ